MQKLRPRQIDVPTYPIGAHMNFDTSFPRVRFFLRLGFSHLCFMLKIPLETHCNQLLANEHSRHISS
jgi:hypothetical protein